jgi:hypothetical protein
MDYNDPIIDSTESNQFETIFEESLLSFLYCLGLLSDIVIDLFRNYQLPLSFLRFEFIQPYLEPMAKGKKHSTQ